MPVINLDILYLTLAMSMCMYMERAFPILLLSSKTLPPKVILWLEFVPPAVLAAILLPAVLLTKQPNNTYALAFGLDNPFLWATFPAFILAFRGSFFGTVAIGMAGVAAIRYFT